jgi:hypothetical protein
MNPTILVSGSDTGALTVAGQTITGITGAGIIIGGIGGAMMGKKKHRVLGALLGVAAGFFAGRALDAKIAQDSAGAKPPIG